MNPSLFTPTIHESARTWGGKNEMLYLTYADVFILRSVGLFTGETETTLDGVQVREWLARNGHRRRDAEMVKISASVSQRTKDRIADASLASGLPAAEIIRRAIHADLERMESELNTREEAAP